MCDYGITISEMLKKFLERIGRPELFKSYKIYFLYDASKLNWDDNTKIEVKFGYDSSVPTMKYNFYF